LAVALDDRSIQKQVRSGRGRDIGSGSLQNVVFSAMVALGCWGMTAFFAFFYFADANHFLYAAMAGLTAVGWTILAVRRGLQLRPSALR